MIKQAYINGFMRKCAEYGVDTDLLIEKIAQGGASVPQPSWFSRNIVSPVKNVAKAAVNFPYTMARLMGHYDGNVNKFKRTVSDGVSAVKSMGPGFVEGLKDIRSGMSDAYTRGYRKANPQGYDEQYLSALEPPGVPVSPPKAPPPPMSYMPPAGGGEISITPNELSRYMQSILASRQAKTQPRRQPMFITR